MSSLPTRDAPAPLWRVHSQPEVLPPLTEDPGPNRYDDPRPHAGDRFLVRYLATNLRGCLLEIMAWLRPNGEADQRVADVTDVEDDDPIEQRAHAVADYLRSRRVASGTCPGGHAFVDIHSPEALRVLDTDVNVEPLLDSTRGRDVLGNKGASQRPHLDQAAVLLASDFGRQITQHCSLAIRDRGTVLAGIAYRSRHDLTEWCWAAYDHTAIMFGPVQKLAPDVPEHFEAVAEVAQLWDLPTHRWTE